MKKPEFILLYLGAILASVASYTQQVNDLKLKDYRPVSIYKNPQTSIQKAKYPAIDVHSHDNINTDVDQLIGLMNEMGIEKKIILSYATGTRFDSIVEKYARYKDRFDIWCGFDYTGFDKPGWENMPWKNWKDVIKRVPKELENLAIKAWVNFILILLLPGAYTSTIRK